MSFVQFQRRLDHSSVAVAAAAGAGDQPPRRPMGLTVDNERQRQALLKFAAFAVAVAVGTTAVLLGKMKKALDEEAAKKKDKDPLGSLATEAGVGEKQTPGFTADQEKEKETFARLTRLATEVVAKTTAAIVVDGMKTALEAAKDIGPLSDDEKKVVIGKLSALAVALSLGTAAVAGAVGAVAVVGAMKKVQEEEAAKKASQSI